MSFVIYHKVTKKLYGARYYLTRYRAEEGLKVVRSKVKIEDPENIVVAREDIYKYFISDNLMSDTGQLARKLKEAQAILNAVSITNPDYQNRIDKLNTWCDNRFSKGKKE